MLTRIVQPSPALESFLDSLRLPLSRPQRDHLLHFTDSLLVCDGSKTLAALQRQFLDSTDPSNWADFLRISPWLAADVRTALRRHQVEWLVAEAQRRGLPKVLYVNLDDSLGKKDKKTSHVEPVDWFHDHNESTPASPATTRLFATWNALRAPGISPPRSTCDFTCATRPCGDSIVIAPPSTGCTSAASSAWLATSWSRSSRCCRRVGRSTSSSTVGTPRRGCSNTFIVRVGTRSAPSRATGISLGNASLSSEPLYGTSGTHPCDVTAADGKTTTYYVRDAVGRLSKLPFDVRVMFSKRHPRARSWAYFASTDLARSVVETLRGYGGRWSCEVVNFYTKTRLGLADFRVRSYEAVERYVVAVHLAWAYVEERLARERSAQIRCYGDVIRRHRDDHAVAWLRAAVEQGIRTGDVESVLNRFLRQTG